MHSCLNSVAGRSFCAEAATGDKTKLTLCRNHSIELAKKFGEIQEWRPIERPLGQACELYRPKLWIAALLCPHTKQIKRITKNRFIF